MKTTMEKTDALLGSQFNPPDRVDPKQLVNLVQNMKRDGFWAWCPIILGNDGRVADGHRRLAAARLAGIESVPVVKVDMDTAVLWAELNALHINFKGRDYVWAYANGAKKALDSLTKITTVKNLRKLVEIGGDRLLIKLVETKTSSNIYPNAKTVATYCGETEPDFIVKVIDWMIDNSMRDLVNIYLKSKLDPVQLYKAIMDNRPIVLVPMIG